MEETWSQGAGDLPEFPHLRMLGHATIHKLGTTPLGQHQNPGIEICFVHKGRFDWTVEERPIVALPNTATVTFPWQIHGGKHGALDIGKLSWLILSPSLFTPDGKLKLGRWSSLPATEQRYLATQLLNAPQPLALQQKPEIGQLFSEIFDEISNNRHGRTWRVNRLLDELLLLIARSIEHLEAEDLRDAFDVDWINQAVRSAPARRWTLADLCRLSGWGRSALNARVREATGYTPMEYVLMLRIQLAQDHLGQTARPITEIAHDLGFSSSQHFSMAFRQRTGMTPSEYRTQPHSGGRK